LAKTAFYKKKAPFTNNLNFILRKKLVKCYIWSISLYGGENWTLQKVDQKDPERFKCGAGEGWRRSVGLIM